MSSANTRRLFVSGQQGQTRGISPVRSRSQMHARAFGVHTRQRNYSLCVSTLRLRAGVSLFRLALGVITTTWRR
jgi:hypothetical protein